MTNEGTDLARFAGVEGQQRRRAKSSGQGLLRDLSPGRAVPMVPRPATDLGNAERLADRYAGELCFCQQQRRWRIWTGTHWATDITGEATRRGKATARAILSEARRAADDNERRALARWALTSESRRGIEAMMALAQSEAAFAVSPQSLDCDDWLLATRGGTVELHSACLRPADPADLITHLAPVDYDPSASCPRWTAFLARIVPDPELRRFLQRSVGYSLTGSMREQCLWILWGGGRNGKSTFLTTVQALLGDYAMQAPLSMLVDRRRDATPFDLADLPGRRLVAVSETREVSCLAEGVIKHLTGGEPMRARSLYGDFFEFQPRAKIWLSTNHKPAIKGEDDGIWRRIHLVPFLERIGDQEVDRELPRKLRGELPGILAWAVRGCLDWQHDGLQVPKVVVDATLEYRREESVFTRFLDDVCLRAARASVAKKVLYGAFTAWCDEQGLAPLSQVRLSRVLKEQGVREERGTGGRHLWRGLGLR
ncbi:MAG: phage/plasmid primase, P4 family, partial [Actinomycetota bacterium]|nr:phage/plasmid primase, P4 family [Actinomycetota bacterium]